MKNYRVIIGRIVDNKYVIVFVKTVDSYNSACRILNEILHELGPEYSGRIEECIDTFNGGIGDIYE